VQNNLLVAGPGVIICQVSCVKIYIYKYKKKSGMISLCE